MDEGKENMQIRRCAKCVNHCLLTEPRCKTGAALAEKEGIWEPIPFPGKKPSLFRRIFHSGDDF